MPYGIIRAPGSYRVGRYLETLYGAAMGPGQGSTCLDLVSTLCQACVDLSSYLREVSGKFTVLNTQVLDGY